MGELDALTEIYGAISDMFAAAEDEEAPHPLWHFGLGVQPANVLAVQFPETLDLTCDDRHSEYAYASTPKSEEAVVTLTYRKEGHVAQIRQVRRTKGRLTDHFDSIEATWNYASNSVEGNFEFNASWRNHDSLSGGYTFEPVIGRLVDEDGASIHPIPPLVPDAAKHLSRTSPFFLSSVTRLSVGDRFPLSGDVVDGLVWLGSALPILDSQS